MIQKTAMTWAAEALVSSAFFLSYLSIAIQPTFMLAGVAHIIIIESRITVTLKTIFRNPQSPQLRRFCAPSLQSLVAAIETVPRSRSMSVPSKWAMSRLLR